MLKSFATLIDVAQRKTDSAAIKVGQLNARLSASDQKHGVLLNYRDEYRARLETAVTKAKADETAAQKAREASRACHGPCCPGLLSVTILPIAHPSPFVRVRFMAEIVITEKASQAKDVRAAVGARYGEILPAEGHLYALVRR